ncbi:MAG: hypothetical protein R3B95_03030 [Nitrospirales bacterium]|nr:hypothetical protein [Nitrospirales bacterium]
MFNRKVTQKRTFGRLTAFHSLIPRQLAAGFFIELFPLCPLEFLFILAGEISAMFTSVRQKFIFKRFFLFMLGMGILFGRWGMP